MPDPTTSAARYLPPNGGQGPLAAIGIAADAQGRFQTDRLFHARAVLADRVVEASLREQFGRELTRQEIDLARYAAAIGLLLAEMDPMPNV